MTNAGSGFKLLAIGDVHLGTRSGRLPDDLGLDFELLTPAAALAASVDRAIAERVDAVVFTGDVVESTNARFEALPPLELAVERLVGEGIRVLAVVGNHDVEALPRLAERIEGFELLGEGGVWGSQRLENASGGALELIGWSFPEQRVTTSPVAALLADPITPERPGTPRVGVLHADLDATSGAYAPVSRSELVSAGLDAWLLGHIHKPSLGPTDGSATGVPIGYLGSLMGLDPTEIGPHGPWLIHSTSGGLSIEQLVLAPLRWEVLDVPLEPADTSDDAGDRILVALERRARAIEDAVGSDPVPLALGTRVRLTGRVHDLEGIRREITRGTWSAIRPRLIGEVRVFVDRVDEALELEVDLTDLARGSDPPALLARKLLTLKAGGEARQELLEEARRALRPRAEEVVWLPLADVREPRDPLSDDSIAETLTRAGTAALHGLLAQRESSSGSVAAGESD